MPQSASAGRPSTRAAAQATARPPPAKANRSRRANHSRTAVLSSSRASQQTGRVFHQRPDAANRPQDHPGGGQQQGDADDSQAGGQHILQVQAGEPGGDVRLHVMAGEVVGGGAGDDEDDGSQGQAEQQDFRMPDGFLAHRLERVRFHPLAEPPVPVPQQPAHGPEGGQGRRHQGGGDEHVGDERTMAQAFEKVREDFHVGSGLGNRSE